ncbi:MAG: hypothetical protein IJU50_01300 [Lachnospiraceae bacterium]|nr:hypothetical protein [Lachnospiraceae bacterium]
MQIHLKSKIQGKTGQWKRKGELTLYRNMPLFKWHFFSNVFPDEKADREMVAYVCKHNGKWHLVNQKIHGMLSPEGKIVPPGHSVILRNGALFRLSGEEKGMLAEVHMGV